MTLSKTGRKFLADQEGLRLKAYRDVKGIATIGIGNTYYENGDPVKMGDSISYERALELFNIILPKYEQAVRDTINRELNQNQFDALVSLCYNIGISGFKGSTVARRVNANPCDPTIRDAFEMWRNSGNNKGILLPRRKREADLYFS